MTTNEDPVSSNLPSDDVPEEIVARPGRYYRNARYLIVAMITLAGLWFAYDGWIAYPREVEAFKQLSDKERAETNRPHSELDIALQHRLAYALIPLGPIMLIFFLYRSRGRYRLSQETLYVPGHPPVPLGAIQELDMSRWDRKGIAGVVYHLPGASQKQQLTLDDFIYDRGPTDQIVDRIKAHLGMSIEQPSTPGGEQEDLDPAPTEPS